MRIVSSQLVFESTHHLARQDRVTEWLRVRTVRLPEGEATLAAMPKSQPGSQGQKPTAQDDPLAGDPALRLLRSLVESFTGRPVRVLTAADMATVRPASHQSLAPDISAPAATGAAATVEFERSESRIESERTGIAAHGSVTTADGREIDVHVALAMERTHREETRILASVGAPPRKDPLVVNLGDSPIGLSDERVSFDLDADGRPERVPTISGAAAYLTLDRNRNGRIDDGGEMFGPSTGDGLAELTTQDLDRNGWIDENDPVFSRLTLWIPLGTGDGGLRSLAGAGIGAVALTAVASPFELRGVDDSDLGAVKLTGIYLREDGRAGSLQEIDLTV